RGLNDSARRAQGNNTGCRTLPRQTPQYGLVRTTFRTATSNRAVTIHPFSCSGVSSARVQLLWRDTRTHPFLLSGQTLGRDTQRERDLSQRRLDRPHVVGPRSEQLLLRRGETLERWIGVRIAEAYRARLDARRGIGRRYLQQRHDRFFERAIE